MQGLGRGKVDWSSLDCHAMHIPTGRPICFTLIAGSLFKYLGIAHFCPHGATLPSRIHDMSTFRIKE